MKFRKVLGKAFRGSWDAGKRGQMPLAQLAEPSLCIVHPNSPAGWFQLVCRPKTGTWKQAPGSQECSHWLFWMLWEKYFCQVRTVTQEHTSQIALYRFWLNVCWMASTLTQSSSSIIYKWQKTLHVLTKSHLRWINQYTKNQLKSTRQVAWWQSINMSMISGSIPTPKNLLNANNKTLRRRGEGRQNGWESSGKGKK